MSTATPAKSNVPADPRERYKVILAGFRAPLPPYKTTSLYYLGLLATTLVMLLLPLIYIGMIACVGYVVWWHLANNHMILGAARGRGAFLALLIYLAPGIVGGILVVFMIKPLFSRPARREKPRSLTREAEPLLFAVVDRICELVHAPKPKRIDVDCDINASASFRSGMLSLLLGNDLVLTIGMPLVAGLSLQQLAGVLAHEFGHFSQAAGMRLTYIIRTINFWFMRVAYERDSWDEWLAQNAGSVDLRIGWILYLTIFFVWVTRKVLWCLMMLGNIVAGFMLRQMEYDADTYEARLVGSRTFAETARQLAVLNLAHSKAMSDLRQFHREGRLVDNLPRLIEANVGQIPAEIVKLVQEHLDEAKTGLTDSHPTDRDRIAAARAFPGEGVFACQLPATALFTDFQPAAAAVTRDLYASVFEGSFDPNSIHSVDLLLSRQQRDQQAHDAFGRFMAGHAQSMRLLLPRSPAQDQKTPAGLKKIVAGTRAKMQELAPQYKEAFQRFDKLDDAQIALAQCEQLLQIGITPSRESFPEYWQGRLPDCFAAQGNLKREQAAVEETLRGFEQYAEARLGAAILVLFNPELSVKIPEGAEKRATAQPLIVVVRHCHAAHADLLALRDLRAVVSALFGHFDGNEQNERLSSAIHTKLALLRDKLQTLWMKFADVPYPFGHAQEGISVQYVLAKQIPSFDDIGALHETCGEVLEGILRLYTRSISRLSELAEEGERALGFEAITLDEPPAAADKK